MSVRISLMILSFSLCCIGCRIPDEGEKPVKTQIFAMDTVMDFTVYGEKGEEAIAAAKKKVNELEDLFSVNKPESDISKINQIANSRQFQQVSSDTFELIKKSLILSERTGGLFDISIYPVVKAWGFTTDEYRIPDVEERKRLSIKVNYKKILCKGDKISLEKGMELDLGGIAKGYVSECLIKLFRQMGVKSAIVSLGGNVQTLGAKPDGSPFQVGIQNPLTPESLLGTIGVKERAVVTSGSYERFFVKDGKRYHHIMDKRTGAPAESDLVSVTVVAGDGAVADGLSTALFIAGSEKSIEMQKKDGDFEMILLKQNGEIYLSKALEKNFIQIIK